MEGPTKLELYTLKKNLLLVAAMVRANQIGPAKVLLFECKRDIDRWIAAMKAEPLPPAA